MRARLTHKCNKLVYEKFPLSTARQKHIVYMVHRCNRIRISSFYLTIKIILRYIHTSNKTLLPRTETFAPSQYHQSRMPFVQLFRTRETAYNSPDTQARYGWGWIHRKLPPESKVRKWKEAKKIGLGNYNWIDIGKMRPTIENRLRSDEPNITAPIRPTRRNFRSSIYQSVTKTSFLLVKNHNMVPIKQGKFSFLSRSYTLIPH